MRKLPVVLSAISILTFVHITDAYEPPTHQTLSGQAVERSVLRSDGTVLTNLGLNPLLQGANIPQRTGNEKFPSGGKEKDIFDLVGDGSVFEDNGARALNHFYNPLDNTGISNPSPDWALEDLGDLGGQNNSFKDARQYVFCALAAGADLSCNNRGLGDSKTAFGLTFQTLGQVIHHLQDMAQPQHVRHDQHLKFIPWFDLIPPRESEFVRRVLGGKKYL